MNIYLQYKTLDWSGKSKFLRRIIPVLEANGVFIQGTATDVIGYIPCNTVRQLAGTVTITCPSNALRM